ncbi:class I SAM-dependent methyltransferase [Streptomyces sp. NPDC001941]|uniref:class I SAM-dependent methyltransferase n=1 Tax=Streptomyces sp. NPDC001941 TaxID=3154659 RepID=UPI003319D927
MPTDVTTQSPSASPSRAPDMAELQELEHGEGHDYAAGSPHIRHHQLRDRLVGALHAMVGEVTDRRGRCRVVEIGAGHGTFTDHLLAAGAEVEVTEMSGPSADALRRRFRHNPKVSVVHDPDGSAPLHGDAVDAVVCLSVLHHIPDYLATVDLLTARVAPGGAFLSFQDPLWYPRRSAVSMAADRGAYFLWRLGQGELGRGLATRARRARGVLDETNSADMAEYHVVRQGVDEQALCDRLAGSFGRVELMRYWSTQSGVLQRLGERLAPPSTFGLLAHDRTPRT